MAPSNRTRTSKSSPHRHHRTPSVPRLFGITPARVPKHPTQAPSFSPEGTPVRSRGCSDSGEPGEQTPGRCAEFSACPGGAQVRVRPPTPLGAMARVHYHYLGAMVRALRSCHASEQPAPVHTSMSHAPPSRRDERIQPGVKLGCHGTSASLVPCERATRAGSYVNVPRSPVPQGRATTAGGEAQRNPRTRAAHTHRPSGAGEPRAASAHAPHLPANAHTITITIAIITTTTTHATSLRPPRAHARSPGCSAAAQRQSGTLSAIGASPTARHGRTSACSPEGTPGRRAEFVGSPEGAQVLTLSPTPLPIGRPSRARRVPAPHARARELEVGALIQIAPKRPCDGAFRTRPRPRKTPKRRENRS